MASMRRVCRWSDRGRGKTQPVAAIAVAKGGGRARTYVRDGRGRFASTPGGGGSSSRKPARKGRSPSTGRPQPRTFRQRQQAALDRRPGQGGYLGKATREAKARLRAAKAKQRSKPSPQQAAAVTRARIRAEGASPVVRLRRAPTTGALRGVKVPRAQGARRKPEAGSTGQTPVGPQQQSQPKPPRAPREPKPPKGKGGKRVDVQIKRAGAGGEYGPDGHFYPAGSWMPVGQFQGGKQLKPTGNGNAPGGKKEGEGGDSGRVRVIKQKPRPRPPLQPAKDTPLPSVDISERGRRNMIDYFRNGFYTNYRKQREDRIELGPRGTLEEAALAARLPPKQVGAAIARLRRMAKDKKEFDAAIAWERDIAKRRGYGYDEMKRGGYLPRGTTRNQYFRLAQLDGAINRIVAERAARRNNRRTSTEDYIWALNNILGTRVKRTPAKRSASAGVGGSRSRIRGPRLKGVLRPISTQKLIAAGGSRWQKGAFDRIYFNQPNTGKVFYDRNTRTMVSQPGDKRGAALAKRMQRAGRRLPRRAWRTVGQLRRRRTSP